MNALGERDTGGWEGYVPRRRIRRGPLNAQEARADIRIRIIVLDATME